MIELLQSSINLNELKRVADTGDLIFFRGKTFGCKVQRFITRSDYDHVAMLLKYKNNNIFLFEATGTYVSVSSF